MNNSKELEQLESLNKKDLISSLLKLKFKNVKEINGAAANCSAGPLCIHDTCSADPCCDGNSQCSQDTCANLCS